MAAAFYIASVVAVLATLMVITRRNGVHALLYLVVSLLSVAVVFYTIGAPFVAALEVIIYAGAIMVLFVFVIMMLNLGQESAQMEREWTPPRIWIGPSLLSLVLLVEIIYILMGWPGSGTTYSYIAPREVGLSLFTTYLLAVEIAGFILMAGIVGAYHIGREKKEIYHRYLKEEGENG